MTRGKVFAWFLLAVWATWLVALQGRLLTPLGAWTPQLGIVLLVALAARFSTELLPLAALVIGVAHCALSIAPAPAILAVYASTLLLVRALRLVVDVAQPPLAALSCGLAATGASIWLDVVRVARVAHAPGLADGALANAACAGLASALASFVLAGWMPYLPGLSPLRRSSPWARTASAR